MVTSETNSCRGNFYGHSENAGGAGVRELLCDHLRRVSRRAADFAEAFSCDSEGRAIGLLHDFGKYSDQFQRRLDDPRHVRGCDHWTAGALAMLDLSKYRSCGIASALAIAGHHSGLGCLPIVPKDLERQLSGHWQVGAATPSSVYRQLHDRFSRDGLKATAIRNDLTPNGMCAADMLDVRMLFSALVDADFLETEAHFDGDSVNPYQPRDDGPRLDVDRSIAALDRYMATIHSEHRESPMTAARNLLFQCSLAASSSPHGMFTLTAPTGAGKTLAMLAFALHHAKKHGLRRIVVVMPFLNIIDQTAQTYRAIFSEDNGFSAQTVLEHHSLTDYGRTDMDDGVSEDGPGAKVTRLLTENWDAPIILTTNVQLLESLMANRTSSCRKLHRLAQSVILCDEIQTLPPKLAVATLSTLSQLADPTGRYRTTLVFSTATQPAFDAFNERITKEFALQGWSSTEIVSNVSGLYKAAANRTCVRWRCTTAISLDELAMELANQRQVLCIVNLKRHAAGLVALLRDRQLRDQDSLLHLSTNMCPEHRRKTLETVRSRLKKGLPVCLIATQCVEAGVDLDFPVVYRALAPLDAIAQAAGRCNRHGRGPLGQVVVFRLKNDASDKGRLYPPGYEEGVDATEVFLNRLATQGDLDGMDILGNPQQIESYYRQFYKLTGKQSAEDETERPLLDAIRAMDFAEVAKQYKLIQNDSIRVLVPYRPDVFRQLRDEIETIETFSLEQVRNWIRRASPFAVNLFRPKDTSPIAAYLEPIRFSRRANASLSEADWFFSLDAIDYDPLLGISANLENLWIV